MWKPIILDVECIVCNKSLHKINHNPREVSKKMGKITSRRSRTPNWSVEEKQYLIELIKERRDIVINKTNNGPNLYEEKDTAWTEILRELTVKFGNKFHTSTIKKVKTQWQNMKRIAREEITLNGPQLDKYSRQSYEVCSLLEIVKDGVLMINLNESENAIFNDTAMTSNIQVKAERIDEDPDNIPLAVAYGISSCKQPQSNAPQPSCSRPSQAVHVSESSSSSDHSDNNDIEMVQDEILQEELAKVVKAQNKTTRNFSTNTDEPCFVGPNLNSIPMPRNLQEFFRFTNEEKQLKLQTLKDERQVLRAMRETAELNKIIAEQRLKHVLWVKKQEMG